jgi:hypothetical protein
VKDGIAVEVGRRRVIVISHEGGDDVSVHSEITP